MARASGRLMFGCGRACRTAPRLALPPCGLGHPAPCAQGPEAPSSPLCCLPTQASTGLCKRLSQAAPEEPKTPLLHRPPSACYKWATSPPATAPARAANVPACQSRRAAIPPPCAPSSPNAASRQPHNGAPAAQLRLLLAAGSPALTTTVPRHNHRLVAMRMPGMALVAAPLARHRAATARTASPLPLRAPGHPQH
jgi:hypothetical protein